jgi:CheY-like chemotaxis protein/PAS domain-containing protein
MERSDYNQWQSRDVARLLSLVETERRYYQDLFSALPVAVAVMAADLTLVAVNREFRRRLGLQHEDLARVRLPDLMPDPVLEEAVTQILAGQASQATVELQLGERRVRIRLSSTRAWLENGETEIVLAVEEPAEAAPSLESALARRLPAVTWLLSRETGQFLWVSPDADQILGLPAESWQTLRTWVETRVQEADRERWLDFYQQSWTVGESRRLEYGVIDGQARPRRFRDEVRMAEEELLCGFTFDITGDERQKSRDRLAARREASERLAARVAHVVNNLLMIVDGYSGQFLESLAPNDPRRGDIEQILHASERLARLTRQMALLARPAVSAPAQFDLRAWARTLPAGVAWDTPAGDWLLQADPEALRSFFTEVLKAAGQTEATIEVEPDPTGGRVFLRLGLGPRREDELERLLDPFSGPKEGTDPPAGPVRLLRALEQTGVELWVEPVGAAACLVLSVPGGAVEMERPAEAATPQRTVLVLEDEGGIRTLIVKTLESAGCEVLEAADIQRASTLCADRPVPDLLISDVLLPDGSGREFSATLRARWPQLPVLFISGFTDDPELDRMAETSTLPPHTYVLAKPFPLSGLLEKVRQALSEPRASGASA